MSDDLIKRLRMWGDGAALASHFIGKRTAKEDCAEAADTIARQQEMLDRALEASFADKARADRAEEDDKRGDAHGDEDARHTSPQKCAAKAIPRITGSPAG